MKHSPSLTIAAVLAIAGAAAAQTTSPERGGLHPASATYSVGAGGGTITIQVARVVGSSGAVGCSYATVSGTAVAGTDFVAASGTLSWASGDSASKPVTVTILNDGVASGNKTFRLRLTNPTGGAWLAVPPASPLVNHEGRALGTTPAVGSPTLWNTATADSVLAAMQVLPANNPWNEDISGLPVASNSTSMVNLIGSGTSLALNRDMNFVLVPPNQTRKNVNLVDYPDESDPGPYPVPDNTPIEGYPVDDTRTLANNQLDSPVQGGDRHGIIVDPGNGYVYEFWQMVRNSSYAWTASNEATFGLRTNTLRPNGWTSGDAAGLPIFPAIPRYDECERGMVEHALRFTVQNSRNAYVYPATHMASSKTNPDYPRMGERFRLKAGVNIGGMSKHPKAVALALKKYGMFMADNGGNWRISAGSDPRLANLNELTALRGSDFEVVVPTGPNGGPRAQSDAVITVLDGGGGSDVTPPAVSITTPPGATFSTSATPLSMSGTSGDNVGVTSVTWTNSAGGSGTASGTTAWSASVALAAGSNTITVTARDAAGNTSTDSVTVTYTPSDTTPPAVAITTPPNPTFSTSTTPLAVSGTASDAVGVASVSWANAATGGSGTASGTTAWSASIPLASGTNAITVTARDAAGNAATDSVTVTYTPPAGDTTPPTLSITSPTNGTAWTATSSPLTVAGTASDNAGLSTVTWSNSAGGSGTAGGTTSWSVTIPLSAGVQIISITAYDTSGNTRTDTLTVDFATGGGGGGGAPPAAPADDGSGRKQCGCGAVSSGFPKGPALLLMALLAVSFRRRTP